MDIAVFSFDVLFRVFLFFLQFMHSVQWKWGGRRLGIYYFFCTSNFLFICDASSDLLPWHRCDAIILPTYHLGTNVSHYVYVHCHTQTHRRVRNGTNTYSYCLVAIAHISTLPRAHTHFSVSVCKHCWEAVEGGEESAVVGDKLHSSLHDRLLCACVGALVPSDEHTRLKMQLGAWVLTRRSMTWSVRKLWP